MATHNSHPRLWLVLLALLGTHAARASGPRYVTGPPFFTGPAGVPVAWSNRAPLYFTDPADLSASVNHAAADALVAAAASVWNVPVANITLAQGGQLAEHVSGSNVYLDSSGIVYPPDVASSNHANIPIAVIYDRDGSVTDTLLGGGASDPSGCRQNAVTESVDLFDPAGYILHAVLILNGRCTGPAPQQQLQLQYQLQRAFGRILGLAWSQANDNVFTGTPTPTYQQALNWPILHPIDILCGSYTYQCLPQPFQLRPDDIASLVLLYGIPQSAPVAGKEVSLDQASAAQGSVSFPTGEGMAGVNVLVQRINLNETDPEPWVSVSAVTGAFFRRAGPSSIEPAGSTPDASQGTVDPGWQGHYTIPWVPIANGNPSQSLQLTTEPVDPLYTGNYAIAPYVAGQVAPSGSPQTGAARYLGPESVAGVNFTVPDAASHCGNGADGTESAPVPPDPSGWSNGLICRYGHTAWTALNVLPNRILTLEVTALDEQGYSSTAKLLPVMGAWAAGDPTGTPPTLAATVIAFNSLAAGMSTLSIPTGQSTALRLAVADQRGDGRPDFALQSRVFYAATVDPASVPLAGATITIAGMGFRPGNPVSINGVPAVVTSWTSNAIVVTLPTMAAAGATDGVPVDIVVSDLSTGASSTMSAALTYTAASLSNNMKLLSAPAATTFAGDPTAVPFAVQIVGSDGTTPVPGQSVVFAATSGSVQFSICGSTTCTVVTDAQGTATTGIKPLAPGPITIQATDAALSQSASFTALPKPVSLHVLSAPSGSIYAGQSASTRLVVQVLDGNGAPMPAVTVLLSATTGAASFDACSSTTCEQTTDASGLVASYITPTAAGPVTLQAAAGTLTTSTSFTALNGAAILRLASAPPASAFVNTRAATPFNVILLQPDGVTPLSAKTVVLTAQLIGSSTPQTGNSPAITYSICNTMTCPASTDYQGEVATWVDLHAAGTYQLQAAYGAIVQTSTIQVLPRNPGLRIVSAPTGNQLIGALTATPFKVQSLDYDGSTPLPSQSVTLSAIEGSVRFDACSVSSCIVVTDTNGFYTMQVTPLIAGPITLEAVMLPIVLQAPFTGVRTLDTMHLLSAPSSTVYSGLPASTPFSISITAGDGITPIPGRNVTFSITNGSATFAACGSATCTRATDANGVASSAVTPTITGSISLLANDNGVTQAATFTAIARPDTVQILSAPSGSIFVNTTSPVPFAAQVTAADGSTPAGKTITLSVIAGSALFSACNAASCMLTTNANGTVSSLVTPTAPGTIKLQAADGSITQSSSFTALANLETVTALTPRFYIAEQAVVSSTLKAILSLNNAPAVAQPVTWTAAPGIVVASTQSLTDTYGTASIAATLGPLGPASTAQATACAWTSICATFQATAVSPALWQIAVSSGNNQTISGTATFLPLTAQVTDHAGHPVAGAPVTIYQTVRQAVTCPAQGRCPVAPILAAATSSATSALDGTFTILPLAVPGQTTAPTPQQTDIAIAAGTAGFAAATLQRLP